MTYKKRKKNIRQRGSKTHGWGAMKKHRGTGNRGGKGNAGSGKRSDAKKPSITKDPHYFGKFGFKKKGMFIEFNPVNIGYLDENANKIAKKQGDAYSIDIQELGFNKLLGSGRVTKKITIKADYASAGAIEKVKKAGGSVEVKHPEQPKEKGKPSKDDNKGKKAEGAKKEEKIEEA